MLNAIYAENLHPLHFLIIQKSLGSASFLASVRTGVGEKLQQVIMIIIHGKMRSTLQI